MGAGDAVDGEMASSEVAGGEGADHGAGNGAGHGVGRGAGSGADRGAPDVAATVEVDWPALRAAARAVMTRAYVPYSRFPVGAAGLTTDGRTVTGCNVENASYGLGLCAECGMVSALHASGDGGRLVAVAVVDSAGDPLMPCGRCRQLLWEHGGPEMLLETRRGVRSMREILPDAFGVDDLTRGEAR